MKSDKRIVKNKNGKYLSTKALKDTVAALDSAVNWDKLFPRKGRPDLRHKKQTRHTIQTINRVIDELREHNALRVLKGEPSAFRKMRQSKLADDARAFTETEPYFRGIFSPNPNLAVKVVRNKDKSIDILRATTDKNDKKKRFKSENVFMRMTPDKFDTSKIRHENDLRREMYKLQQNQPELANIVGLKTGDNMIEAQTVENFDDLVDEAAILWTKYAAIVSGITDEKHKGQSAKDYNHPNQWLNGVWWISNK